LAEADRGGVVAFWSDHSLGYNNRAKYLHEAAGQVEGEYGGTFPETPEELQELMGVGPYTANAVASFAFDNGDAVVDTNVKRVHHRAFAVPDDDAAFAQVASDVMPDGESRIWNNAIMELGGVACGTTPRCDEAGCPWRRWCHAYETGDFTAPDVPEQPSFEVVGGSSEVGSSDSSASTTSWRSTISAPASESTIRPTASTAESGCAGSSTTSRTTGSWRSKSAQGDGRRAFGGRRSERARSSSLRR